VTLCDRGGRGSKIPQKVWHNF